MTSLSRVLADQLRQEHETDGLPTGALSDIFATEPVPLRAFLYDSNYLGLGAQNIQLSDIQFDFIRHFEQVYSIDTYIALIDQLGEDWIPVRMCHTLAAMWGKGSGKDSMARMSIARVADLLLNMHSPQSYYGIPTTDEIQMLNVAVSSPQAHRAFFRPLRNMLVSSPRFEGMFRSNEIPADNAKSILLKKNLELISGHSQAESQEGLNLIAGIADEIAAFKSETELQALAVGRQSAQTADYIIDMMRSSASTRFPDHFKIGLISYPRYEDDAIMSAIAEGRKDNEKYGEQSSYYVSGPYPTWEVNPRFNRNSSEIRRDYEKDPEYALAKYECKPPKAVSRFLRSDTAIAHGFHREEQPAIEIEYYWGMPPSLPNMHVTNPQEGWQVRYFYSPDLQPMEGAIYCLHGDIALRQDRAGVAMAHVAQYRTSPHRHHEDPQPVVKVDFIAAFEANMATEVDGLVQPREVKIRWYRQLIFELMAMGFNVGRATFDGFQCLSGDTKIPLLDGTVKTIAELDGRKDFWVYSINSEGRIVPGHVTQAQWTGYRSDMLEVVLDNGESIKATSDHKFMMRDGSYCEAKDLTIGDSLMPLYRRQRKVSPSSAEYEQVWHPESNGNGKRWQHTHSVVSHAIYGKLPKGWVTHHIDCSQRNNSPDNLRQMTSEEHSALHRKVADHFKRAWKNPEWRENHIALLSQLASERQRGKTGGECNRYRHDVTFEMIIEKHRELYLAGIRPTKEKMMEELGISIDLLYSRVRENGYRSWKNYRNHHEDISQSALKQRRLREKQRNNHKIVAIRPAGPEHVYDLEVEEHHNFATEAGVFIHNSIDMIQQLTEFGIVSEVVSLDRTTKVYDEFKNVLYDGRLDAPHDALTIEELQKLSHTGKKIDHLPGGSKDCADAVAGAVFGAVQEGGSEGDSPQAVDLEWHNAPNADANLAPEFHRIALEPPDDYSLGLPSDIFSLGSW